MGNTNRFVQVGETVVTYPVAAAAYKNDKSLATPLTHACAGEGDTFRALCRKVKPSSLLDDGLWDGEGSTEREPTCPICRARDPRFAK